jgi:uncharacterized protein (UPF0332 family)
MKPEVRDYICYRLQRAREALEEARILLDSGHRHTAVNRPYYACFFSVSALLLTEGRSSPRRRSRNQRGQKSRGCDAVTQ